MSQCLKTTMTAQYLGEQPNTVESHAIMEVFCNETVRLVNQQLKAGAADPKSFESDVSYGWFQIPEQPGLYAIQVIGPHDHFQVCTIGDDLQQEADSLGYPIIVNVVRV